MFARTGSARLALNNCTWRDVSLEVQLNPSWGLSQASGWNLYRWHPEPAQDRPEERLPGGRFRFPMRPFRTVLLEAVPAPGGPSLRRAFPVRQIPVNFNEASRDIAVEAAVTPQGLSIKGMLEPFACT